MKKIYEYKQHLSKNGLGNPEWIVDGGYFWDGVTYVAIIPDETERKYYIPDTLIELSKQDLIDRVIAIQHSDDVTDRQCSIETSLPLTDDELVDFIDSWWQEKVDS